MLLNLVSKSFGIKTLYFSLSSYHAIYIPLDLEPMGILALIPGNDLHLSYQNFSDSMMLLTFVVLII